MLFSSLKSIHSTLKYTTTSLQVQKGNKLILELTYEFLKSNTSLNTKDGTSYDQEFSDKSFFFYLFHESPTSRKIGCKHKIAGDSNFKIHKRQLITGRIGGRIEFNASQQFKSGTECSEGKISTTVLSNKNNFFS